MSVRTFALLRRSYPAQHVSTERERKMTLLPTLVVLAFVAYILYTRRESIERAALKLIVPMLTAIPAPLVSRIWKYSLIIDKSSSRCGRCGYGGGLMSPHHAADDLTRCDDCGVRWSFGWMTYESTWNATDADRIIEDVRNYFTIAEHLGVHLLGYGNGDLMFGSPHIYRLLTQVESAAR